MRIIAGVLAVIVVVMGLFWLSGGFSDEMGKAARQADFRFATASDHHYLDPQRMSWLHDIRVAELLFEPLVKRNPDLTVAPGVAESWQVSDDGLTYTFHLRETARWSNGDPVTAGDFAYAWRRAIFPDLAADYAQLMFVIQGAQEAFGWRNQQLAAYTRRRDTKTQQSAQALWQDAADYFEQNVGISAPDDHTLVVQLDRPVPYFLELCAFATFMPVHAASVEAQVSLSVDAGLRLQDDNWTRPDRLVTNGPYTLAQWRFKQHVLLTANPHYWDRDSVGPQAILQRVIENPQAALLAYNHGEIDWVPDLPTASSLAADLVAQQRPDVHQTPSAGTYFYNFNCLANLADGSPNPLADPRVRRALSMAIDRQTIVSQITRLNQPPAHTFVPPNVIPGYESPVEAGARFDVDAARRLLAEAGYPDGQGLTGLTILYNTGQGHENIAQFIQRTWQQQLGVSVRLEGVESRMFGQRLKNQDYHIARAGWFGDYRDPTTFLDKFRSDNGNNDAAWRYSEFDQLMQQADHTADPAQRLALLREAEALMLSHQPVAPIFQYTSLNLFDPQRVSGLKPNAWHFRRLDLLRITR